MTDPHVSISTTIHTDGAPVKFCVRDHQECACNPFVNVLVKCGPHEHAMFLPRTASAVSDMVLALNDAMDQLSEVAATFGEVPAAESAPEFEGTGSVTA